MRARALFLLLFGLSGAAGLVYEVVWTRQLTLVMGHSLAAVSTVLAAFMGGLAGGAALAGRAVRRVTEAQALRAYAAMELVIAASALAVPAALAALRPLLAAAYDDGQGAWFGPVRLIVSLVILSAPAAAMGATLPLAARWFLRRVESAGAEAGDLYAANTIGAAIGAGAGAIVLVPMLGSTLTSAVAVGLNVTAATGAWLIAARAAGGSAAKEVSREPPPEAAGRELMRPSGRPWLATAALALTGFVALASEVAWTRVLALVIGPTTYAFGIMLAVFITGLALGSFAGARLVARSRDGRLALASVMIGFTAATALALWRLQGLPLEVATSVARLDGQVTRILWEQALTAGSMLLPIAVMLGAAFPVAVRVAARARADLAGDVARLYAGNTVGAIAGSLAAGFLLVPRLGLHGTLVLSAALAGLGAVVVVGLSRTARLAGVAVAAVGAAAVGFAWQAPRLDPALLSSGAYKYLTYLESPDPESILTAGTLEYYREGASTVSVRRAAGARMLAIDGKVDASDAGDMLTQKLLAHLPLLLHPAPREVAVIGLGSGVTMGAALAHPIARADVVEISPEVYEASARFADVNRRPLDDPRARAIVGDGRTHLLLGRGTYDVIISEPSNPWMAGIASLFTREFFAGARARLASGGILCQWAHTYDIQPDDLRSIVATFASVFPDGTMWLVGDGDLLLVGSDRPLTAELDAVAGRLERGDVAADLATVGVADAPSLLSLYVGGPDEIARFGSGALVQTDDRTALEFSAIAGLYRRTSIDNSETLRSLMLAAELPAPVAEAAASIDGSHWLNRARMHRQAEAFGPAADALVRALMLAPDHDQVPGEFVEGMATAGRTEEAEAMLRDVARRSANVPASLALSRLLASRGRSADAIDVVVPLTVSHREDPRPIEQLGSIVADLGDAARLARVVEHLQAVWPERPASAYYAATLRLMSGAPLEAVREAERALALDAADGRNWDLLGVAYASADRPEDARRAFETAIDADGRNPATYVNLGLLELRGGRPRQAASRFAEALILDPRSGGGLAGLADALGRMGAAERADRVRNKPITPK